MFKKPSWRTRRFLQNSQRLSILQIIGGSLLLFGVGLLIYVAFSEFVTEKASHESSLAAVGFFLIMIGIALLFPDMLKGNDKETTSSMRVAVFMIVSVFVVLAIKTYWNCSIDKFKLDSTWAYLIAAALGSKAVQSLGENNAFAGKKDGQLPPPPGITPFQGGLPPDILTHDPANITTPPQEPPASITFKTGKL